MSTRQRTTLIIGGTGKTGQRVAQRLVARGVAVRNASRSSSPRFDWTDRSTWEPALAGVEAMYLTYYPDLAVPPAAPDIEALTRLAVANGVKRIVLLSGRGEPQVLASERAVRECGASFTIVRAAFFCQNFSEGFLVDSVRAGEVAFPAGDVAEPFIDAEDIADVVAVALGDDAHAGRIYELTGPRLVTFGEAVETIARVTGKPMQYVPITMEQYAVALAPHVPPVYVGFFTDLFAYLLDGHNAHLSDDVERVLGRKPRDFADYARAAAATGAWS